MDDIAVSVHCMAFNQSKYIRKTLEGFVMQETNFKYEVIVHDDASTDGTDLIIKEFAEKYPNLFVTILQKENQYSKGVRIGATYLTPKSRGKYIACCEGDDYWTDPTKLQRQYDIMETHPECSIVVHKVQGVSEDGTKKIRMFPQENFPEGIIEPEVVVHKMLADNEWVFQTTSYFFRKEIVQNAIAKQIKFYIKPMYGDQAIMQLCACEGKFYYIDRIMSSYRMSALGSTVRADKDNDRRRDAKKRHIAALNSFNEESDKRFDADVAIAIQRAEFAILETEKNFKEILKPKWKDFFSELPKRAKIHIYMSAYLPWFDKFYLWFRLKIMKY